MKIFPDKFPDNIPYLLAGFIGGFGAIFGLTALIAEPFIGRPSSTHAIGFIFVPIYAAILALACFFVGLVVRGVISKFVVPRTFSRRSAQLINTAFVCVLAAAFFSGVIFIQWQETKQRPRVIFNSGQLIKMSASEISGKKEREATFVFSIYTDDKDKTVTFQWNGKKLDLNVIGDNTLKVLDKGNDLMTADLTKFDYIGRIYVLQYALNGSDANALAILVRLRATSRRSMLLIYNSVGKLIYQELLDRQADGKMSVMTDASGQEYLYLDVDKPTIYSSKKK